MLYWLIKLLKQVKEKNITITPANEQIWTIQIDFALPKLIH